MVTFPKSWSHCVTHLCGSRNKAWVDSGARNSSEGFLHQWKASQNLSTRHPKPLRELYVSGLYTSMRYTEMYPHKNKFPGEIRTFRIFRVFSEYFPSIFRVFPEYFPRAQKCASRRKWLIIAFWAKVVKSTLPWEKKGPWVFEMVGRWFRFICVFIISVVWGSKVLP